MYGVGRLQPRTTCVFYQFQIYDNIAEKGCAGGLKFPTQFGSLTDTILLLRSYRWKHVYAFRPHVMLRENNES